MALTVQTSQDIPDSTYFTTTDVEPDLEAGTLTIYDGNGSRRSWGTPGVTSTVVLHDEDLVAVHVGFHHKHRGGQFWRYYRAAGEDWRAVRWAALTDDERMRVLGAAIYQAPGWAKTPGKLRSERPEGGVHMVTAYKLVRMAEGGRLFSVYDGTTEYRLGVRLGQQAADEHGGGYYSYPRRDDLMGAYQKGTLWPERYLAERMTLALLEVEIGGTLIDYGPKVASTYLRPVRVIETFIHTPTSQPQEVA